MRFRAGSGVCGRALALIQARGHPCLRCGGPGGTDADLTGRSMDSQVLRLDYPDLRLHLARSQPPCGPQDVKPAKHSW